MIKQDAELDGVYTFITHHSEDSNSWTAIQAKRNYGPPYLTLRPRLRLNRVSSWVSVVKTILNHNVSCHPTTPKYNNAMRQSLLYLSIAVSICSNPLLEHQYALENFFYSELLPPPCQFGTRLNPYIRLPTID